MSWQLAQGKVIYISGGEEDKRRAKDTSIFFLSFSWIATSKARMICVGSFKHKRPTQQTSSDCGCLQPLIKVQELPVFNLLNHQLMVLFIKSQHMFFFTFNTASRSTLDSCNWLLHSLSRRTMGKKDHTAREDNHEETKGTHLKSDHLFSLIFLNNNLNRRGYGRKLITRMALCFRSEKWSGTSEAGILRRRGDTHC